MKIFPHLVRNVTSVDVFHQSKVNKFAVAVSVGTQGLENLAYFSGSSPEVMFCVNTVSFTSLFDNCQKFDVKVTHACRHSLAL